MINLLNTYDQADAEKQRIIILSLVSPEHFSKTQVMELFECTKHKIDMARKWRRAYGPLQQRPEKRKFRQKLNLQQAKHFLEFLFGSNFMQDVDRMLTAMRSNVVQDYKQHCKENLSPSEDEFLSDSTLWKILRNIKPNQKHAVVGLDDVTANGLKGFLLLEDVVSSL